MAIEPHWDDVRIFLALYRERHLARAAKRLGLDSSTASRRLGRLEEELGSRLFERTSEGLHPTIEADQLLPAAEETERGLHRFSREAGALDHTIEGVVRISVPPGLAEHSMSLLAGLFTRWPLLRLEVDSRIEVSDLSRREADIALRTVRPRSGDLVMSRLLRSRWVPATSPDYAAALGRIHALGDVRWIGWSRALSTVVPAEWLRRHTDAEPILRSNSLTAQIEAAKLGLGVALVSEPFLRPHGLVPVRFGRGLGTAVAELPVDDLWLVAHRSLRHTPRIAAVWDHLCLITAP